MIVFFIILNSPLFKKEVIYLKLSLLPVEVNLMNEFPSIIYFLDVPEK